MTDRTGPHRTLLVPVVVDGDAGLPRTSRYCCAHSEEGA